MHKPTTAPGRSSSKYRLVAILAFLMAFGTLFLFMQFRHSASVVDGHHADADADASTASSNSPHHRTSKRHHHNRDHAGKAGEAPLKTTVIEIDFTSQEFTNAWRSSSKRETHTVPVRWAVGRNDSSGGHFPSARVTFYGKSSLKLKYTARRSVEVFVGSPGISLFDSSYEEAGDDGGDDASSHQQVHPQSGIQRFVLLSLWEDTHRIAYRTSAVLLKRLGLFYPASSLVELRCTGKYAASICVAGSSTLGVYLAIEYPSDAIRRVVSHRAIPPVKCGAARAAPAGGAAAAAVVDVSGEQQRVDVATRNWFYFEKPPVYDLLSVPSYKRDSPLSPLYRRVEADPLLAERELHFHLDQYLAWLVVNTALRNGDYDDEVFFWAAAATQPDGDDAKPQPPEHLGIMAWDYDSIFAPCHRKGKQAIPSSIMFCAETPLERKIHVAGSELRRRYEAMAACLLNGPLSDDAFANAVRGAVAEFESIAESSVSGKATVLRATWYDVKAAAKRESQPPPPNVREGAETLRGLFRDSRRSLLDAIGARDAQQQSGGGGGSSEATRRKERGAGGEAQHVAAAAADISKACAPAVVKKLRAALKTEYKKTMPFTSGKEFLAMSGLSGGDARIVPNFGLASPSVEGTHCVVWQQGACTAARHIVVRSAQRGKAEFGVAHFLPPSLSALLHAQPRSSSQQGEQTRGSKELEVWAPAVWPLPAESGAAGVFPVVVQRFTGHVGDGDSNAAKAWDRSLEVQSVKFTTLHGRAVALIRGFGAFFCSLAAAAPSKQSAMFPPSRLVVAAAASDKGIEVLTSSAVARHKAPAFVQPANVDSAVPSRIRSGETHTCGGGSSPCACTAAANGVIVERGGTLVVPSGCVLLLASSTAAASITIADGGRFVVEGSTLGRAAIASTAPGTRFWGPISCKGAAASIELEHVVLSGSGVERPAPSVKASVWHHHTHTAAIVAVDGCTVTARHAAFVGLRGPAVAAATGAKVTIDSSLVQYAEMGIECVACAFVSRDSAWTHFASAEGHESNVIAAGEASSSSSPPAEYEDNDNDGMYLSGGEHKVIRSVIARAHDDGIDTGTPEHLQGAGNDGGSLLLEDTIIEDVTHEGIAFSSGSPSATRRAVVRRSLIQRAQQCVEMGYSGSKCEATLEDTVLQHCHVGLRYGDNYRRPVDGTLRCSRNCTLRRNDVNVLNLVRKTGEPKADGHLTVSRDSTLEADRVGRDFRPCGDILSTHTTD